MNKLTLSHINELRKIRGKPNLLIISKTGLFNDGKNIYELVLYLELRGYIKMSINVVYLFILSALINFFYHYIIQNRKIGMKFYLCHLFTCRAY